MSIAVAIGVSTASIAGIAFQTAVYPTDELRRSFVPNDAASLIIGLPVLLGCLWLTRRGKLVALLCLPGALLFVLYDYIAYLTAVPFSPLYPLYLVLVVLSVSTITVLLSTIDAETIKRSLVGRIQTRVIGGILIGLGFLFFLRAAFGIASALNSHLPLTTPLQAVNVADVLITPLWVVAGVLLWAKHRTGYVVGLSVLCQAGMLFAALLLLMFLQPYMTVSRYALTDVLVVFAMSLTCFIPLAIYLRAVTASHAER